MLIFSSIILTLGFILPFIWNFSIIDVYTSFNKIFPQVNMNWFLFNISFFILCSWFIAIWYSKKVKISIIWVIWSVVYLYLYYKVIIFSSWNLIWDISTIDIIMNLIFTNWIREALWNSLWIWFYFILVWFLLNTIWVFNNIKNLILVVKLSNNWEKILDNNSDDKNVIFYENIFNKKDIVKIWFITLLFIIWLIFPLILTFVVDSFILSLLLWIFLVLNVVSYISYLNIKTDIFNKLDLKNEFIDILKKLNKEFIFFIVLFVTYIYWNLVYILSISKPFFDSLILGNIIQIHIIVFLIITYLKIWKIDWFSKELENLKHFEFINTFNNFIKSKIDIPSWENLENQTNINWEIQQSKWNFTIIEIGLIIIIFIVIIVWISKIL